MVYCFSALSQTILFIFIEILISRKIFFTLFFFKGVWYVIDHFNVQILFILLYP